MIIDNLPIHTDNRGYIKMLFEGPPSYSEIFSVPGTLRANHKHSDIHVCNVLDGEIHYFERPEGSTTKPTKIVVKAGQTFYTQPNVEHCMYFPVQTTFLCVSKLSRKQSDYENDTVRLGCDLREEYYKMGGDQ